MNLLTFCLFIFQRNSFNSFPTVTNEENSWLFELGNAKKSAVRKVLLQAEKYESMLFLFILLLDAELQINFTINTRFFIVCHKFIFRFTDTTHKIRVLYPGLIPTSHFLPG